MTFPAEQIGDHRHEYLNFEGHLPDDRGSVRSIDRGYFIPYQWTPDKIVLCLHLRGYRGRLSLRRAGGSSWWVIVSGHQFTP
jgi:hypothetical protein